MQDIGNLKSIMYGVVITIIFVISSCDWNVSSPLAENDSSATKIHVGMAE